MFWMRWPLHSARRPTQCPSADSSAPSAPSADSSALSAPPADTVICCRPTQAYIFSLTQALPADTVICRRPTQATVGRLTFSDSGRGPAKCLSWSNAEQEIPRQLQSAGPTLFNMCMFSGRKCTELSLWIGSAVTPAVGLEPTATRLRDLCSTDWARWACT